MCVAVLAIVEPEALQAKDWGLALAMIWHYDTDKV